MSAKRHFEHLAQLLEVESAAEARQLAERASQQNGAQAERSGNCLVRLAIRDEQPALGGRVSLTLGKRDQTLRLCQAYETAAKLQCQLPRPARNATRNNDRGVLVGRHCSKGYR